ncbi:hypothetical protein DXB59_10580 [Ruminococcus sp. OM05-10BH]|nr:hypothetical protein DXB59_10580 [Ruminococcus sp. OM05-10BH]
MLFYTIMILILGILSAGITVFFFFRWRQNRNVPEDINTENTTVPAHISIFTRLGTALFLLVFTVGFMSVGVYFLYSSCQEDLRYSGEANGTVVEYTRKWDTTGETSGYLYAPVVRYQAEGNGICMGTGNVWSSRRSFEIGEQITIRYNPDQTDIVSIEGNGLSVGFKMGFGFFLFGFTASILVLIFFVLKLLVHNQDTRNLIMGRICVLLIGLLIAGVWIVLAGLKPTAAVFALFGLYVLIHRIRR